MIKLSDFGTPDDPSFDNYDAIKMAVSSATSDKKPLHVDGVFWHRGDQIELPHNTILLGEPGYSAIKQDPAVYMPRFKDHPEGQSGGNGPNWIRHAADCKRVIIEGIEFDAGILGWTGWGGDFFGPDYDRTAISNTLRNTPICSGLQFTNHGNHPVDGLHVTLRQVHIHDYAGSCMLCDPSMRLDTRDCSFGNSVSGRVFYRGSGQHANLHTYGISRTSISKISDCQVRGWRYESDGAANPWPDNADPQNVIGPEDKNLHKEAVFEDISLDLRDSGFDVAFRGDSARTRITGVISDGHFWETNRNASDVRPISLEADVLVRGTSNFRPTVYKYVSPQIASLEHVNIKARIEVDGYIPPWPLSQVNGSNVSEWFAMHGEDLLISMAKGTGSPARQHITLHLTDTVQRRLLLHLRDLDTATEVVPTVIELSGEVINSLANLVGTKHGQTQSPNPSYVGVPVLIRCKDLTFDFPGGSPFIGSSFPRQLLQIMSFENCRTRNGKCSEDGGELFLQGETVLATKLFTWPKLTTVTPIGSTSETCLWSWEGSETDPTLRLQPSGPMAVEWSAGFPAANYYSI